MNENLPKIFCSKRVGRRWAENIAPVFFRQNVTGRAPKQSTWLKTAWDDGRLHVLFHVEDTHIAATLSAHDAPLYTEEVVEIFLDPTGDGESYFEIEVNPLNATFDAAMRRTRSGYRQDARWHCEGLQSAVVKNGASWEAEISVPFESLAPSCGGLGKIWRANFCRIDRPPGAPRELSAWSPTWCRTFHAPRRFGVLEFVA